MQCVIFKSNSKLWIQSYDEWIEYQKSYILPRKTLESARLCAVDDDLFRSLMNYLYSRSAQKILQEYWSDGECMST